MADVVSAISLASQHLEVTNTPISLVLTGFAGWKGEKPMSAARYTSRNGTRHARSHVQWPTAFE